MAVMLKLHSARIEIVAAILAQTAPSYMISSPNRISDLKSVCNNIVATYLNNSGSEEQRIAAAADILLSACPSYLENDSFRELLSQNIVLTMIGSYHQPLDEEPELPITSK